VRSLEWESDDVSIELKCGECGKTLRVADKYAGRRASCPACRAPVDIPAQEDDGVEELEELEPLEEVPASHPADESGYALDESALDALAPSGNAPPRPVTQDEAMQAAGLAEPTPTRGKSHGSKPLPGHEARPELSDREKASRAAARRSLITKVVLLLAIAGLISGGAYWYFTTLGAMVKIVSARSVQAVHALDGIDADPGSDDFNPMNNPLVQMGGGPVPSPTPGLGGPATGQPGLAIGGTAGLYVTRPDQGGNYLLVELDIREGLMKSRNQWSGYNVRFRASEFQAVADTGQTVQPLLLKRDDPLASPARIYLGEGSNPQAAMPVGAQPTSADYQSQGRHAKAAGTLAFDGSDGVSGELSFRSLRAFNPAPGVSGVTMEGGLSYRHPSGLVVDYAYDGMSASVSWPDDANAWVATDSYLVGSVTTMELHGCALLIPKPAGATRFDIRLGGESLVSVSTSASTGPAPSPPPGPSTGPTPRGGSIASSGNPGGTSGSTSPTPTPTGSSASSSGGGYFSALVQARRNARGIQAASNMRQIGIGLEVYRSQNNGRFPDALDELKPYMPDRSLDALLDNPRKGDDDGFIYEPPGPDDIPAATPVLWEARGGYKDLSGRVLYGDGSVRGD
jgi:hypothetical protein